MRLDEISKKEFKGKLAGTVKTCPGCKGKGHRADHDEPSDDEYCAVCAGTGKVATKGTSKCPDCKGRGHYADDDEPMDDEYCYTCAGTGEIGPGGIPKYNPGLDPDMEPPPDPDYLKAQKAEREKRERTPVKIPKYKPRKGWTKFQNQTHRAMTTSNIPESVRIGSSFLTGWNKTFKDIADTLQIPIIVEVSNSKKANVIVNQWLASAGISKPHRREIRLQRAEYGRSAYVTVSLFYSPDVENDMEPRKRILGILKRFKAIRADGIDGKETWVSYYKGFGDINGSLKIEYDEKPTKKEVVEYVRGILRKNKLPKPSSILANTSPSSGTIYAYITFKKGTYKG